MGESLNQQRRVRDEGLRVVKRFWEGWKWQYLPNKDRLTTCQQPR